MEFLDTLSPDFNWQAERIKWPVTSTVGPGLEGAIACETSVAWVDPSRGALYYRGIPIEEIVERYTFEEVTYLLIEGEPPDENEDGFASFRRRLADSRSLPHNVVEIVLGQPPETHPTRLLRAGISALGCFELTADDDISGTVHWEDLRIIGQLAELVSVVVRHTKRLPSTPVDFSHSLAGGVVAALKDGEPSSVDTDLLDLCWILYADHGLDAPTFTSMIVGSCLADPYYTIVAGLSALRGPLLGGAGQRVLEQLLELKDPDEARSWVKSTIAHGGRIAGFGHRMYRGPDPRVSILRDKALSLTKDEPTEAFFKVALAVEEEATSLLAPKGIHINANYYAALIFHLLGADPDLVPCLYAVGRTAGIIARIREYQDHNRLFRPLSRYVGASPRQFIPVEQR